VHFFAGVTPGCSSDELRSAFRAAIKRHHPDVKGGSGEVARRLLNAYQTLRSTEDSTEVPDDAAGAPGHLKRRHAGFYEDLVARAAASDYFAGWDGATITPSDLHAWQSAVLHAEQHHATRRTRQAEDARRVAREADEASRKAAGLALAVVTATLAMMASSSVGDSEAIRLRVGAPPAAGRCFERGGGLCRFMPHLFSDN